MKLLFKAIMSNRLVARVYFRVCRPDRRYMEDKLLPTFVRTRPRRVLSVGVQTYCAHYSRYFAGTPAEYWTIDLDPRVAKLGSRGRHIVANITDIHRFFGQDYFDIILLNGVFGWGIDGADDQDRALASLRRVVRGGGILLVGWDTHLVRDDLDAMGEARGWKHANSLGLPSRSSFPNRNAPAGSRHIYDLFTAG